MSNFSGLNIGLSALLAHQQAAETVSHNIANANTDGYSRRRAELQSEGAAPVPARYAVSKNQGTGVRVDGTTRIRDEFLEAQFRNESATANSLSARSGILDRIEGVFPEPSDHGLDEQLGAFWNTWHNVVNDPGSESARAGVLEKGQTVIDALHLADRQLRTQHGDAVTQAQLLVDQANSLATQVNKYDQAIRAAVVAGQSPSDLLDQRDKTALELAKLTGGTVFAGDHSTVEVFVAGRALVHGDMTETLQVQEVDDPAFTPLGLKKVQVSWVRDGYPATLTAGSIAGYVSGANESIPTYMTALNGVAQQLVTSVNDLHTTGKDLDGATGRTFFEPTGTTARDIALSADVAGQPRHVVAASATGGALDTSIAEQIAKLADASPGATASYRSLIIALGSDVRYVSEQSGVQDGVVQRLDEDRKAASGVNLDEEMVNLVAAQKAYSAAARVITTIDEMLDTLINRTGTVGR